MLDHDSKPTVPSAEPTAGAGPAVPRATLGSRRGASLLGALAATGTDRLEAAVHALQVELGAEVALLVDLTADTARVTANVDLPTGFAERLAPRLVDGRVLELELSAADDACPLPAELWSPPGVVFAAPLRGERDEVVGALVMARGRALLETERDTILDFAAALGRVMATERAVADTRHRHERLMEQSADSIFLLDADRRFASVNSETCRMLGFERDELLGRRLDELLAPGSPDVPMLKRTGERLRYEQVLVGRDGRRVEVEANVALLDNGLAQGIARDIGHRRRVERQLTSHLRLLAAIRDIQSTYIGRAMSEVPWERLLEHLLATTPAQAAFVCELPVVSASGTPLVLHQMTRRDGRCSHTELAPHVVTDVIARLDTTARVWLEEAVVPEPHGATLVLPLRDHERLVGLAGLVLQATASDDADASALEHLMRPLLDSFANIIVAFRSGQAHKAAQAEAARLAWLLDQASNEILVFEGRSLHFLQANDRARRNLGFSTEELRDRAPLDLLPRIGRGHFDSMLEILRGREQEHINFETVVCRKDNTVYPVDVSMQIARPDDQQEYFVVIMQDVSARKQAEARASYLVHHDRLTALPNRLGFIERLESVLTTAQRDGSHVAVLFLDLDRFHIINDTLGHDTGDRLLKRVARRLTRAMRPGDTLARLGGDEFTVILPEVEPIEEVGLLTQRLLDVFNEPFDIDEQELFSSASIGVTLYPDDATDIAGLLKHADTALAHAKRGGRNTYAFFTSEMNARAIERLALENELRRAMDRDELRVHYQPQVDLRTGRITAVEALLRWQHPRLGLVSPTSFIPLAEETGLIIALGEWVLRTACSQTRRWHEAGHRHLRIAVNLSARQMVQNILPSLQATLLETGIDPRAVELELTESLLMNDNPATIQAMRELQTVGISFSIDDFGTGYSNLGYLKQLPIDTLKIDRSFVRDVIRDPDDAAIAKAIIAMAHGLGIQVIAEGVETEDQLEFLRRHRCDAIQGYLFSPPVPPEELGELLERDAGL